MSACHADILVDNQSSEAKEVLETAVDIADWQGSADGHTHWFTRTLSLPQGQERWVLVRTNQGEGLAQATLQRQVDKAEQSWRQKLWHLSNQRFACQADAQSAMMRELICRLRVLGLQWIFFILSPDIKLAADDFCNDAL